MRALQIIGGFIQVTLGTAIITIAALIALLKAIPAPAPHKIEPPKAIHTKVAPPPEPTYLDCRVQYKTPTHPSMCVTRRQPKP
jgi:hypothetical protein